jgi:hypothetical protein
LEPVVAVWPDGTEWQVLDLLQADWLEQQDTRQATKKPAEAPKAPAPQSEDRPGSNRKPEGDGDAEGAEGTKPKQAKGVNIIFQDGLVTVRLRSDRHQLVSLFHGKQQKAQVRVDAFSSTEKAQDFMKTLASRLVSGEVQLASLHSARDALAAEVGVDLAKRCVKRPAAAEVSTPAAGASGAAPAPATPQAAAAKRARATSPRLVSPSASFGPSMMDEAYALAG